MNRTSKPLLLRQNLASGRGVLVSLVLMVCAAAAMAAKPMVAIEYGQDLQKLCNVGRETAEYAMCFSFVGAVLEVLNNNSIYGQKVCFPHLVNVQHAVVITKKWLDGHPTADIEAASLVVTKALADAYPCKAN